MRLAPLIENLLLKSKEFSIKKNVNIGEEVDSKHTWLQMSCYKGICSLIHQ